MMGGGRGGRPSRGRYREMYQNLSIDQLYPSIDVSITSLFYTEYALICTYIVNPNILIDYIGWSIILTSYV